MDHHLPFQDRSADGQVPPAPTEEEMMAKLFNRASIGDMMADVERELGIRSTRKSGRMRRRTFMLSMDNGTDRQELERILAENSGCRVLIWKEHWTPMGELRMFLVVEQDEKPDTNPDAPFPATPLP